MDFSLFLTSCWVCTCWNSSECSFFRFYPNFGQSFGSKWISWSARAVFIFLVDWIYSPWNRSISVFSHIRTYYFSFQEAHIPLVFYFKYFLFFFYSCHKILHKPDGHVNSLDIKFPSSNFLPCSVGPFHSTWHMSVVLCRQPCGENIWHLKHFRDVVTYCSALSRQWSLCFLPFLIVILLMFVTQCFPRAADISSAGTKANSILLITSLEVFSFSCAYALHLETFHFENVFCLPSAVHLNNQVFISCFFYILGGSPCCNNLFFEERRKLSQADFLQRFNNNESREVCCLILGLIWINFSLFFVRRCHNWCLFFTGPVLHHPPWNDPREETYLLG